MDGGVGGEDTEFFLDVDLIVKFSGSIYLKKNQWLEVCMIFYEFYK